MSTPQEPDFPPGHPKRFDYDPRSPEAVEWRRVNVHPKGERDFPVDHPKAVDTKGNTNSVAWTAGVNPHQPSREPFTGRTPEQAKAAREIEALHAAKAMESPVVEPVIAPDPPPPRETQPPSGQPRTWAELYGV